MRERITASEVRNAIQAAGIKRIDHHDCALCGFMVRYFIRGEDVFFDPSCDCTYGNGPEASSFQNIADWYNMQSTDGGRTYIAERIGLKEHVSEQ